MTNSHTTIKICGLATHADLEAACQAGADMVGLVRAPQSPRHLALQDAKNLVKDAPSTIETVGVYVEASEEEPGELATDWVQLHGGESPQAVTRIARACNRRVIRGFHFDAQACRSWDAHPDVDLLLIDGPQAGSGRPFDHAELVDIIGSLSTPVMLAGGLDPQNVHEVLQRVRPWGVDVSSGVETSPGRKDHALIAEFCAAVRSAGM